MWIVKNSLLDYIFFLCSGGQERTHVGAEEAIPPPPPPQNLKKKKKLV